MLNRVPNRPTVIISISIALQYIVILLNHNGNATISNNYRSDIGHFAADQFLINAA